MVTPNKDLFPRPAKLSAVPAEPWKIRNVTHIWASSLSLIPVEAQIVNIPEIFVLGPLHGETRCGPKNKDHSLAKGTVHHGQGKTHTSWP